MAKVIAKYQNIYVFIITLSLIGCLTGYFYYKVQDENIRNEIILEVDLKGTLDSGFNNMGRRFIDGIKVFLCGLGIVTILFNVFKCFTIPFEIGFLFSMLKIYSFKFSLIYLLSYYIIPYLFMLVLIRISISISYNIVKYMLFRERKIYRYLRKQVIKFMIILFIMLFYEFIISIFSYNINLYLMTFL